MSDWLDDAAKGLAEDRLSRRAILGRAAAGLGGALLTGVTPSAALGTVFRPCKFLHCRKGTSCCEGPHGLGCCPKAKCCGGRCCHHNQQCASHAHGVCCSKHDKACSSEGQTTCCPSGTTCCKGVSIPGGRVNCCKHGEVCDSFQGTCCKKKCGPVCCQPGERCINGVCSGCPSGQTECGPNTCCPPGQKCCPARPQPTRADAAAIRVPSAASARMTTARASVASPTGLTARAACVASQVKSAVARSPTASSSVASRIEPDVDRGPRHRCAKVDPIKVR